MDRKISSTEKRKEKRKTLIRFSIVIAIIVAVIIAATRFLGSSITSNGLIIGTADKGTIEITVNATGKLVPLMEEIIVSPINSRILEVYKNPGEMVEAGEPILKLELASVETEYKQKLDEREKRKSMLQQLQIKQDNSVSELQMQQQIKEMQLKQFDVDLKSERYLDSIGASTPDKVRRMELNYEEAKLQLQQLKQKIENEKKNVAAELRVEQMDLNIFEKTLDESARLLKDARILSPQKATLTFINNQIGAQVAQGTQVAVVADLTRFKVEAEVADSHADKLALGAKAIIESGKLKLTGTVVNIIPLVANGILKFTVVLDDASHEGLRSGLKVNVNVKHGVLDDVVRIPNGSYFNVGKGQYELWVINGNKAEKRKVRLGESSFEYVEVVSGLQVGDKVIISNMDEYKNKQSLDIK